MDTLERSVYEYGAAVYFMMFLMTCVIVKSVIAAVFVEQTKELIKKAEMIRLEKMVNIFYVLDIPSKHNTFIQFFRRKYIGQQRILEVYFRVTYM